MRALAPLCSFDRRWLYFGTLFARRAFAAGLLGRMFRHKRDAAFGAFR
jgi:hypothetical protein